jgi:D-alanyl-D-alanine carboxypeptidase (penicillin-binding protein 5/6)
LEKQVTFRLRYDSPVHAPIKKGQAIGSIDAMLISKEHQGEELILTHIPMQAARDVEEASWFGKQLDHIRLWWKQRDAEEQGS